MRKICFRSVICLCKRGYKALSVSMRYTSPKLNRPLITTDLFLSRQCPPLAFLSRYMADGRVEFNLTPSSVGRCASDVFRLPASCVLRGLCAHKEELKSTLEMRWQAVSYCQKVTTAKERRDILDSPKEELSQSLSYNLQVLYLLLMKLVLVDSTLHGEVSI